MSGVGEGGGEKEEKVVNGWRRRKKKEQMILMTLKRFTSIINRLQDKGERKTQE